MDLRTGKTYESPEAAKAAGVPESDLVEVVHLADGRIAARAVKPSAKALFRKAPGQKKAVRVKKTIFSSFRSR